MAVLYIIMHINNIKIFVEAISKFRISYSEPVEMECERMHRGLHLFLFFLKKNKSQIRVEIKVL